MRKWAPGIVIVVLLALLLGLPVIWRPAAARQADGRGLRLVVITPHNEQIRFEIEHAFSDWHRVRFGQPVSIDWRAGGGTSDIERQLMSVYGELAKRGRMDDGGGYDVVFGGGDYFFHRQLKPGVRLPSGENAAILAPLDFDADFIRQVYPSPDLAGNLLYDPEGMWWGVVLSSFGIVYNADVLGDLGLAPPRTWADMCDPRLAGWIGMADPSHSGSVRVTYDAVLQRYGWERGWRTLRRMSANARYFANSASKVPIDVAAGEAAMGVCIDFYGRFQAEVVGHGRLGYVAPADATVITADPVAVLRGAPNHEVAERFVRFLLSVEGQAIWALPPGTPGIPGAGGPQRFALRRPPVRRDMYQSPWLDRMVELENPFELAKPLQPGAPSYFRVLPTVMHAMAMDIHDDLREAWVALNAETDPRKKEQMLELFDALPFTQEELLASPDRWRADPHAQTADRIRWTKFFRNNYRGISHRKSDQQ